VGSEWEVCCYLWFDVDVYRLSFSHSPIIRLEEITDEGFGRDLQMEAGYSIWDFKGQLVQENKLDRFKQLLWRPRPPTLLSRDDQKKIRKNLRDYSRQFEEQDQLEAANLNTEVVEMRKRLIDEWNAWRKECSEEIERRRKEMGKEVKKALKRAEEAEKETEEVEEEIVEVVSETIEVIE